MVQGCKLTRENGRKYSKIHLIMRYNNGCIDSMKKKKKQQTNKSKKNKDEQIHECVMFIYLNTS